MLPDHRAQRAAVRVGGSGSYRPAACSLLAVVIRVERCCAALRAMAVNGPALAAGRLS